MIYHPDHYQQLINFHWWVDEPCEPEACIEANCTSQYEESIRKNQHVPKVQNPRYCLCDLKLCEEVKASVEEKVHSWGARSQIWPPPPKVVLATQLEVAENNCDLSTSDNKDHEHDEQEAKYIIELMQPDWCQNEEKLDEDSTKWEDASYQNREDWVHIPGLLWDLPRDLGCLHRILRCWLSETQIATDNYKWNWDAKP